MKGEQRSKRIAPCGSRCGDFSGRHRTFGRYSMVTDCVANRKVLDGFTMDRYMKWLCITLEWPVGTL